LEGCRLAAQKGADIRHVHEFPFSGVCRFVGAGAPRIEESGALEILLVESSTEIDSSCDTSLQAVTVNPEGVALSTRMEKSSLCSSDAWDAQTFYNLAGDVTPLSVFATEPAAATPAAE
jgi:hypothetical protein